MFSQVVVADTSTTTHFLSAGVITAEEESAHLTETRQHQSLKTVAQSGESLQTSLM